MARFLESGELAATVAAADVVILPYVRASQSGAVVLAQALGAVVVATAVGGIPEQVTDRVTGRLLPAAADQGMWRDVLIELTDPELRVRLALNAKEEVRRRQLAFAASIRRLLSLTEESRTRRGASDR